MYWSYMLSSIPGTGARGPIHKFVALPQPQWPWSPIHAQRRSVLCSTPDWSRQDQPGDRPVEQLTSNVATSQKSSTWPLIDEGRSVARASDLRIGLPNNPLRIRRCFMTSKLLKGRRSAMSQFPAWRTWVEIAFGARSVRGERPGFDAAGRLEGIHGDSGRGDLAVDELQPGGDGAVREQAFARADDEGEHP
jgi:hypothetical protein